MKGFFALVASVLPFVAAHNPFVASSSFSARLAQQREEYRSRVLHSPEVFTQSRLETDPPLAPFPKTTAGTFFAGVFSDNVVLQRAPAAAAVYGVVIGASATTKVQVQVQSFDGVSNKSTHSYTVDATVEMVPSIQTPHGGYARWKALLTPSAAGGNFTVLANCSGCSAPDVGSNISSVTFGDVWFCSGQSNMWLVMHFDESRNRTYDAILFKNKYKNIRMHTMGHNAQPDVGADGYDKFIAPPPAPREASGGYPFGGWLMTDVGMYANESCRLNATPSVCIGGNGDDWRWNSVDQFSAACWHFGEALTDHMEANNETVVPLGLISSHWGGTMIEMWQPNATLNAGVCKNSSGLPYAPEQNQRWDIDSGALYNGMVLPFVNMTIKGALWYQGENNVFQCYDREGEPNAAGPDSCGNAATNTGYACMMENLISTWRKIWSVTPHTTDSTFPFGLVTLAGGTSESHGRNMGAFRYAQTGNTGLLPNSRMPNTFVAQGYDAGDPCSGGGQCCQNVNPGNAMPCYAGEALHTFQFMGGLHPRVKKVIGKRLAAGARAFAYSDDKIVYTGPVLTGCHFRVTPIGSCGSCGAGLVLEFDQGLLKKDSVQVLNNAVDAMDLMSDSGGMRDAWSLGLLSWLQELGPSSPLEIQLNGTNLTDGVWVPVKLASQCSPSFYPQDTKPCFWDTKNNSHSVGFDSAVVPNLHAQIKGTNGVDGVNVTGVRYAWAENPCCPGLNRDQVACPPGACPIQTFNSSLPAVPFWATIKDGKCDWISTKP